MSNEIVMHENAGTAAAIFSPDGLDKLLRFADVMANGRVAVPAHLAGKPADCLAVAMQAAQWGMNPFAVAQKTHVISGTLGYEAQLVNAVITTMSPTKDRINYEWFGPWEGVIGKFVEKTSQKGNKYIAPDWTLKDEQGCGVRVWATMKGEDSPRVLELMLSQAQVRNSTLWASDPKQQLAYLAVKRWSRLHCPDVIMGVYTPDELEGEPRGERDITPRSTADLNTMIGSSNEPAQAADSHGGLDDDVLVAGLQEEIELADTLEKAVAIGEKIGKQKDSLTESTFRSLRARAAKLYKHHDARRQIEAAINSLDASAPDAKETFVKVESDLQRLKGALGDELHEGFSITLGDMRAEYV
ncbi:DNA single-strand annealing protein RecT-like protein [Pantoea brenneri]|uniref:DNA single-strand annealing protein RecT-like protein n=1 Tax=Pantoea brenneri TaxID=472694 RepID=A0AAX3J577_9GAMM|nr:RecT family recombinase [Pantoea brenneri]VXB51039.1 DNA single-strand annealing protein RecT-like protein [Pantoea brenneri]